MKKQSGQKSRRKKEPAASDFRLASKLFVEFCKTIAALRHPVTGCPWDLEQTHRSLRRYMLEEAHEAAEAMTRSNSREIAEELGDVLLQVVLNAQLGADAGTFTILDVIDSINAKMIRRHPHVFGDNQAKSRRGKQEIRQNWDQIKAAEKKQAVSKSGDSKKSSSVFERRVVYPATRHALEIGKTAAKINFDWPSHEEVLKNFLSEVKEAKEEIQKNKQPGKSSAVAAELGDVYFSLAQLCRHLGLDPEIVAADGNRKFLDRFETLEDLAHREKVDVRSAPQTELERLWNKAKTHQQKTSRR
jgi:MazG family protein